MDLNTYGKSSGRNGSYSTNYQITGRELMTPDEVRQLDNKYAILFIRGERPIKDLKYDIFKHPNLKYTPLKNGKIYEHGTLSNSVMTVSLEDGQEDFVYENSQDINDDYEIISSEEIDEYFKKER